MKTLQNVFSTLLLLTLFATSSLNAQFHGGLEFNGTNNIVQVLDSPLNIIGAGDFTIEAWIKGDESTHSGHEVIFSNRGPNPSGGGILFFFHDLWGSSQYKMLSLQLGEVNMFLVNNGTFDGSLLDGECHHLAITRSANSVNFYADGVFYGTRTIANPSLSVSMDRPLWIGRDLPSGSELNGLLSQCRIWNVARTEAELFDNKDIRLEGDEVGLLAYWQMNEGDGQTIEDLAGEHDGTLCTETVPDYNDPAWSTDGCIINGIDDEFSSSQILVYPNPTLNLVTLELEETSNLEVKLINQAGIILLNKRVNSKVNNIELGNYPEGIYFLQVFNKEKSFTTKIVKLGNRV